MDTLPRRLMHQARTRPARPALREKSRGIWKTLSWQALADEVQALAGALAAQGLVRGAHVALLGENRPRLLSTMAAVQWLGGVAVPLFSDTPAGEIVGPLQATQASFAFAENQEQVDKLLALLPQCPALRRVVYDDPRGMRHYTQPALLAYDALLAQGRAELDLRRSALEAELARGRPEDPAALFLTAGSADPGHGVRHSHAALIDRALAAAEVDGLGEADVTLAYLPPAWIGQHMLAYVIPLVTGACVSCPESSETLLQDMREIGPSVFLAPPRVLEALATQVTIRLESASPVLLALHRRVLAVARRSSAAGTAPSLGERLTLGLGEALIFGPLRDVMGLGRVRVAYAAGDAISPERLRFYRTLGVPLKPLYGSTETGFFVAMPREAHDAGPGVGPAAPGVEFSIGADRELRVRSAGLCLDCVPGPTPPCDAEGWHRTGDAGILDDSGALRVIGRLRDLGTLPGGALFAPRPVETALKGSPYIAEAVVFGPGWPEVGALIAIDLEAVGHWADQQGLAYTGYADLSRQPAVQALVQQGVEQANAELANDPLLGHGQVARFVLLPRPLDADAGELTRMRTLRRDAIAGRHASLVQALRDGQDRVRHAVEAQAEDGRSDAPQAELTLHTARTFPVRAEPKAA